MTRSNELLVSAGMPSDKWQLPPVATKDILMIGWRLATGRSVDDGVPPEVAPILAHALTSLGWVSFFEGSNPNGALDDRVSRIMPSGFGGRVKAAVAGLPKEVHLVSTRRPELVTSAFDASFFSWVLQGQAILISPDDRGPPVLDWAQMLSLTGGEGSALSASLSVWGASAVVRPGVDGAVAGFVAASGVVKERALASIREAAASQGFDVRLLTEGEFEEALAG